MEQALSTFHTFDVDASGTIDMNEINSIMRAMGQRISEEELNNMMEVADPKGTGEIDFEGFCIHVLQIPKKDFMAMLSSHLDDPVHLEQTIGSAIS